ncbi:response regulator [Maricaulis sp. CAU 1757]
MDAQTPMPNPFPDTSRDQRSVLIVDDCAALRGALRVSLQAFGFSQVLEADSVARALDTLDSRSVDLVITDWKMRPRNGLDLVRALRPRQAARATIPVIMLSAYSDDAHITEAHRAGVDAFLAKPFTASSLARVIRHAMQDSGEASSVPNPASDDRPMPFADAV